MLIKSRHAINLLNLESHLPVVQLISTRMLLVMAARSNTCVISRDSENTFLCTSIAKKAHSEVDLEFNKKERFLVLKTLV